MAQIPAKQVQALRASTGLPLMDCKRALVEAGGDEAAAIEALRKRFAEKMISKADRVAANGRIGAYVGPDGAALIEVRCETDFVATNDLFKEFANQMARQVVETGITTPNEMLASKMAFADDRTVQSMLEDAFSRLGEKLELARCATLKGHCGSYVHFNGKVSAVVALDQPQPEFAKQVCMHVAAQQGEFWMSRDEMPTERVEEERARARESVKDKPPQIVDKIVEGKMNKWFAAFVLPEQPFALDDKKTVSQAAKDAGVSVTGFCRFEVGRLS